MGLYTVLMVVHTIIVFFLIGIVLLQRSDSDGMGGLSGGGGNQFMSGRSAANLMTRTTAILATAFMLSSLILAVMGSRMSEKSILDAPSVSGEAVPVTTGTTKKPASSASEEAPSAPTPSAPKPE